MFRILLLVLALQASPQIHWKSEVRQTPDGTNQLVLTGNLDEGNSAQVVDILLRLAHEEGRCVIIITHDSEIAARMDAVYTIRDGVLES